MGFIDDLKSTFSIKNILGEDPLHIDDLPLSTVPDYMRKKGGFWYWTGAMISMAFIYQVVTGLILLLYYNPANAYVTTEYFKNSVPYGSLILTTHLYGAYAMIVLVYIHMYRNYFNGAYKKPRELQWVTGVLLLATTIGVGYFGYSMSGDVLSVDATDVGRGIALSSPIIGPFIESIFFGNGTSVSLFIRMLGWHIILSAAIGALFGFHFYLAEANGLMPSQRSANYKAPAVEKDLPEHKPWYPYNLVYMIELGAFVFGLIILIPSIITELQLTITNAVPPLFDPYPQVAPSSPLAAYVPPYPPWFLLFVYKAVDFKMFNAAGALSALAASTVFGVIPLLYFLIVPFIDRSNDLHPLARPFFTGFGILGVVYMAILSLWGAISPGIPISTNDVLAVFIPPFIIVMAGMYMLSSLYKKGSFKPSLNRIIGSFIIFFIFLVIAIFEFAASLGSMFSGINAYNVAFTIISGSGMTFAALGTMRSSEISNLAMIKAKTLKGYEMSKKTAMILSSIIVIISMEILWLMLLANPLNLIQEEGFGIGLGILMILIGIEIRIYRMVYLRE